MFVIYSCCFLLLEEKLTIRTVREVILTENLRERENGSNIEREIDGQRKKGVEKERERESKGEREKEKVFFLCIFFKFSQP